MRAFILILAGYCPMWIWVFGVVLYPIGDVLCQPALAPVNSQQGTVKLNVNQGRLFPLAKPPIDVLVTNPDIADIQIAAFDKLFIFGKKPGEPIFWQ